MTASPRPAASAPHRLREMTPDHIAAAIARDPRLLVPIGTCEPHGPHLPLGCDTILVERLADDLSERHGILRAPTLEYGVNTESDASSAGGATLRKKTLHRVLNDLLDSWENSRIREFILLTAHGRDAHQEALATVITTEARVRVVDVLAIHVADLLTGQRQPYHGDEVDTSLLLYLTPGLVHMELAQDYIPPARRERQLGRARLRVPRDSAGSIGLPSLATPEKGRLLYERILTRVSERILASAPVDE
jgi:creatinine amidohydrolase